MQGETSALDARVTYHNVVIGLVLLSAVTVLLWQFSVQSPRVWKGDQRQTVQVQGQYYSLSPEQMSWLHTFTTEHFSSAELANRERVHAQIDRHLDSSFAQVSDRLPMFADWYYSLRGEYSRMAMAVLSATSLADGDFVARRAAQLLFPEQVWESGLKALELDSNTSLLSAHMNTRDHWISQVQSRLGPQLIPSPIGELQKALPVFNLDALSQQLTALAQISALDNRIALNSLGTAVLAGPALWRAVAARNALASSRVIAATGARGGGRLASAAGGAALCAPGGPLAIACAVGAGVATWVATDWLLLQVDEAVNREELLATMQRGLTDLRGGLEQELLAAYDARLEALQTSTQEQITQGFSLVDHK